MTELFRRDVLDHGFVRVVDVMGDDAAVVQAARVSYGDGTKSVRDDRGLIRYLMRHRHTSPFEMCEIKLHCKMPIFVARQWVRHRTASINEYSARYSELRDEFYMPEQWRAQSEANKQGSDGVVDEPLDVNPLATGGTTTAEAVRRVYEHCSDRYEGMLNNDTAREQARIILPLSTYTEWYWKIDLHNLLHFLDLRQDSHAQYEIRVYADAIAEFVEGWVPVTWEAYVDYVRDAVTFSRQEMQAVREKVRWYLNYWGVDGVTPDRLRYDDDPGMSDREWREFEEKLLAGG